MTTSSNTVCVNIPYINPISRRNFPDNAISNLVMKNHTLETKGYSYSGTDYALFNHTHVWNNIRCNEEYLNSQMYNFCREDSTANL